MSEAPQETTAPSVVALYAPIWRVLLWTAVCVIWIQLFVLFFVVFAIGAPLWVLAATLFVHLFGLLWWRTRTPLVVLDEEGITENASILYRIIGKTRWSEISRIDRWRYFPFRRIVLVLTDTSPNYLRPRPGIRGYLAIPWGFSWRRFSGGAVPPAIWAGSRRFDEVESLIREYHRKYRDRP